MTNFKNVTEFSVPNKYNDISKCSPIQHDATNVWYFYQFWNIQSKQIPLIILVKMTHLDRLKTKRGNVISEEARVSNRR